MKTNLIIFWLSLLGIFYTRAAAQYHAVYIPEERLGQMKSDGNPSDWDWVPNQYGIETDKMVNTRDQTNQDRKSFDSKIIVGWNEIKNKVYVLMILHDNFINVQLNGSVPYYMQDCLQFAFCSLDPDDEKYAELHRNNTLKAHFMKTPDGKEEFIFEIGPNWILQDYRFVKWGCNRNKDETVFELELSLWDNWNNKGHIYSKPFYLEANKKIRLTIAFNDLDFNEKNVSEWATIPGKYWYQKLSDLSVFVLDSPINKRISYHKIESIIKTK